jgi:hypothetical protein
MVLPSLLLPSPEEKELCQNLTFPSLEEKTQTPQFLLQFFPLPQESVEFPSIKKFGINRPKSSRIF